MPRRYIPDNIKLVKGSLREHRINKEQPASDNSIPEAPKYLDSVAKEAWDGIVEVLKRRGTIDTGDSWGLGQLCLQISMSERVAQMRKELLEQGEEVDSQKMDILDRKINHASEHIRKWLPKFGLSQEDMHKMKSTNTQDKGNPFSALKNAK